MFILSCMQGIIYSSMFPSTLVFQTDRRTYTNFFYTRILLFCTSPINLTNLREKNIQGETNKQIGKTGALSSPCVEL